MNIQHILTLSIDAIALCYSALMAANFVLRLLEEWQSVSASSDGAKRVQLFQRCQGSSKTGAGICAEILKPIFEEEDTLLSSTIVAFLPVPNPWELPAEERAVAKLLPQGFTRTLAVGGFPHGGNVSVPALLSLPPAKENNLIELSIRQLKKQASAAKIKNYNVMTKAQLVQALSA